MNKTSLLSLGLVASLILNAFLAGYMLSRAVKPMRPPPMPPFERMNFALEQVSPKYRTEIESLIDRNLSDLRNSMFEMRKDFDKVTPILVAPEFDIQALEAIQQSLLIQDKRSKTGLLILMIDIANILPNEERIRFFKEFSFDRPSRPRGPGMFRNNPRPGPKDPYFPR